MLRLMLLCVLSLLSACAGASPDPIRMAANLQDMREIRDSESVPVRRWIARNKLAHEQGASAGQLAAENGLPMIQLTLETYAMAPASRPAQ